MVIGAGGCGHGAAARADRVRPASLRSVAVRSHAGRTSASVPDLVQLLREQHDARLDAVTAARDLRAVSGTLESSG